MIVIKEPFPPMASLLTVTKAKKPVPGSYIVTLKEGVSLAAHVSSTQSKIASTPSNIVHEFNRINGYAGKFSDDDLNDLRAHPEIASIEEDGIAQTCPVETQSVLPPAYPSELTFRPIFDRTDATWGLGRISSVNRLTGSDQDLNFTYKYENSAGVGAVVYVIGMFLSLTV